MLNNAHRSTSCVSCQTGKYQPSTASWATLRARTGGLLEINAPALAFGSVVITQECLESQLSCCNASLTASLSLPKKAEMHLDPEGILVLRSSTAKIWWNDWELQGGSYIVNHSNFRGKIHYTETN